MASMCTCMHVHAHGVLQFPGVLLGGSLSLLKRHVFTFINGLAVLCLCCEVLNLSSFSRHPPGTTV